MDIEAARTLINKRITELEEELKECDSFGEKRWLLSNVQSNLIMLCYLDMLEKGKQPMFHVKHSHELAKQIIAMA